MTKIKTIHTSRTIMFAELSQVMNHSIENSDFDDILTSNVFNKLSNRNLIKTNSYLKQLYGLDKKDLLFSCFKHYWTLVGNEKKSILALLFALSNDFLLQESIDLVVNTNVGERVAIEKFDDNIEKYHQGRYSDNTRRSAAQNVASSWKQAGYLQGKVKNIRVQPAHDYYTVAFALLLSYLHGDRGEYILLSKWVKALAINTEELRNLIKEAAKRDLLQYQYGGNVTVISFENQLKTIK
ncbi:MAG: hypothetical protein GX281_07385 [Bacteroidales bacterium]|jgi:hypothetical protein|nr:hypothetical protein [Bacteroidales bacterium]NLK80521.1 hypothetical protein [Bacteroidales bacterium]HPX79172.1 hypothetical protein [Bacteroidales bacterium]